MHRTAPVAVAALALALVVLAGCATTDEPAASGSASPSPSLSASPSAEPSIEPSVEPSDEPADPTAAWAREDLGWASIPLPDDWTLEQRGETEWMAVSDRGLDMVSVFRVPEGQYAQDLACLPEDLPAFEAVERLPYEGAEGATADAWAAAGTVVEVGTTVRELSIGFDGEVAYVVELGITEVNDLHARS